MNSYYAEIVGVAAAAASLYAAHAKTIIPLRVAAVIANELVEIDQTRKRLNGIC